MDVQEELSQLGQIVQAMAREMQEDIREIKRKLQVECALGHWHYKDEICPYCEKLKTEIVNDNCKSNEEICEDGECDCDPGECAVREEFVGTAEPSEEKI